MSMEQVLVGFVPRIVCTLVVPALVLWATARCTRRPTAGPGGAPAVPAAAAGTGAGR